MKNLCFKLWILPPVPRGDVREPTLSQITRNHMPDINYIIKRNNIIKRSFLIMSVLIMLLILYIPFNKGKILSDTDANINKTNTPNGFELNINNPIFEGMNRDNLPYKIVAKVVTKQNDNIYNLNNINGRYGVINGDLQNSSIKGVFNEITKVFTLSDNVKIIFNDYILAANKINFDLHSSSMVSDEPIEVNFQNSVIKALSFYTDYSNNIINLEGNVVSIFNLNDL